jgi:hypothetical protein
MFNRFTIKILALVALLATATSSAADKEGQAISLAEGKLVLQAPANWERKEPRSRIIEHEFAVPGAKDKDGELGRVTVMGAGGSIEANIDRWIAQFKQPDGGDSKKKAKIDKKEVAGIEVHLVDLTGIYQDAPGGPFAKGKTIDRENYRMLAAIISGGRTIGNYFIKFYGPADVVKEHEKGFATMIESLQKK